ncbi:MAG: AI-2E family transporter [Lachnospiraceae bacterium]
MDDNEQRVSKDHCSENSAPDAIRNDYKSSAESGTCPAAEDEKKVRKESPEKNQGNSGKYHRFAYNSKYYTICIYTVVTVFICAVIVRAIFMWESTSTAVHNIMGWTLPYLMGIFLACLLYPLVVFLEKHVFLGMVEKHQGLGKGLSILLTYVIFLGVIIMVIGVIIPQVWQSILDLATAVPGWYGRTMDLLVELNEQIPEIDFDFITKKFQEFGNAFLSSSKIQQQLQDILMTVVSTSVSVVAVFLDFLIALIVSVYLLIDLNRIGRTSKKILRAFVSDEMTGKIIRISKECYDIFSSFVSGKMVDSLIIGILCFIAMNLLRLPYALVISVVVGVTNMIPYFGPFIGAVPGCFILLMVSPVKMLIFLILILVLQQFDGLYLGPKILGDSTGLRPAWIIFSVSAGGVVCGVLGMFLGVPVVAVIGHLINIWIDYRLEKRNAKI